MREMLLSFRKSFHIFKTKGFYSANLDMLLVYDLQDNGIQSNFPTEWEMHIWTKLQLNDSISNFFNVQFFSVHNLVKWFLQ